MATDNSNTESYERAIGKLIEIVSRIHHNTEWDPTPIRKELEETARRLETLAELLASSPVADELEAVHDKRGISEPVIGPDGFPVEQPEPEWPSYQSIKWDIRELAKSAQLAAEQLPDPRKKRALEFAARALLHLRYDYGFPHPTFSDKSPDVIELERVCASAGLVLSRQRYRGALSASRKTFDPHFAEPEYKAFLNWVNVAPLFKPPT